MRRAWMRPAIAACALALPLQAGMIAVHGPASAGMEALRAAADGGPVPEGVTVREAASCALSAAFSVPEGTIAYFRGDASFETLEGFEMLGESVLFESAAPGEAPGDALGKPGAGGANDGEVARAIPTTLRAAARAPGAIRLEYALAAPGRVRVEVYAASGRRLAAREWNEASAGAFERSLPLAAAAGPLLVRWKSGGVLALVKVPAFTTP